MTPDERDDAAVIKASVLDPDAFAVIFDRHAPYVHRYLARRLGQQAADDMVAETFMAAPVIKGEKPIGTESCVPAPAYLPDLPTTGEAMLKYLKENQSGTKGDLNALAKDMLGYLNSSYLLPQSRAAIFEAATKIEGLRTRDGVKDAAGRTGIEISWDLPEVNHGGSFIVDPATYAYLGTTTQAQLTVAIVDKPGQRP